MFSIVVRHPASLAATAPVIFLQYLAAIAIVEGIKTYDVGYQDLKVKLKWPNDVCKLKAVFTTKEAKLVRCSRSILRFICEDWWHSC